MDGGLSWCPCNSRACFFLLGPRAVFSKVSMVSSWLLPPAFLAVVSCSKALCEKETSVDAAALLLCFRPLAASTRGDAAHEASVGQYSGFERAMSVAFTTFRTLLVSLHQGTYGNTLYILSSFIRLLFQTNTKTVAACNLTAWERATIQSFFGKRNRILCERTT